MTNHVECLADILPEYGKKAKLIAQENESRLKECGAFSSSEFQDFRDRIARAYLKLIKESVPAIVIGEDNLIGFIKRGEYLSQDEISYSSGTFDPVGRRKYSDAVYGKRKTVYERYGVAWRSGNPTSMLKHYGEFLLELDQRFKSVCTINAFDSNLQWPSYREQFRCSDECLYPVPYQLSDPWEAWEYFGCLMQYPSKMENIERNFEDGGRMAVRKRNLEVLQLLEGEHPDGYIECHIHSRVTVDDVKIYSLSHDQHQSTDQRPQRICKSTYR